MGVICDFKLISGYIISETIEHTHLIMTLIRSHHVRVRQIKQPRKTYLVNGII